MSDKAVLVADDDPDFRELVKLLVETWGGYVIEAKDFASAVDIARAEQAHVGLVLLDYFMPGDREAAVQALRELVGPEAVALCTACGEVSRRAAELGLSRVFPKPLDLAVLERAVRGVGDESLPAPTAPASR